VSVRLYVCEQDNHLHQEGYVFIAVSLFVNRIMQKKTTRPIFTKFGGKVEETIRFHRLADLKLTELKLFGLDGGLRFSKCFCSRL